MCKSKGYYVKKKKQPNLEGVRRRVKMPLHSHGGLMAWIESQEILDDRVIVADPLDLQRMLNDGMVFDYYKFYYKKAPLRWRREFTFSAENAHVLGDQLILNGNSTRLYYMGVYQTDPLCLDSFVIPRRERTHHELSQV